MGAASALVPFYELPLVDARPGPVGSEEDLFNTIQRIYADHGFVRASEVTIQFSEDVLIPYTTGSAIHSRRFLGGPGPATKHMAQLSAAFFAGRLDAFSKAFASEADANKAYRAFMIMTLGHEFARALSSLMHSRGQDNPWVEETRAMDFEYAILRRLVDAKRLPDSVFAEVGAFDKALLGAAPVGLVDGLPKSAVAREARFNQAYPAMLEAVGSAGKGQNEASQHAVDTVLALWGVYRLERAKVPIDLRELRFALAPARDAMPLHTIVREQLDARRLTLSSTESDPVLKAPVSEPEGNWVLEVLVREQAPRAVVARSVLPDPVPKARLSAVAELLATINRELDVDAFEMDPKTGVVRVMSPLPVGEADPTEFLVGAALERNIAAMKQWRALIGQVIAGKPVPAQLSPGSAKPQPSSGVQL